MIDISTWTAFPISYWQLKAGDVIRHHELPDVTEIVTEVASRNDELDDWTTVRTDGPLLGGTYYSSDQAHILAPPEPVEGYLLARQPPGFRDGVSECTCLYRRETGQASWYRISADPDCTLPHNAR